MAKLAAYSAKRDFTKTAEPAARPPGAAQQLRRAEARRAPPALRLPPRARRRAEELGGHQGPEPRSRREAAGRPCRGPPARLRRLRGHDPEGPVRRRHGHALGPRHAGSRRATRARATARATSTSALDGEKLHGRWHLVRMRSRAGERNEQWLLIKADDEWPAPKTSRTFSRRRRFSVETGRSLDEIAAGAGSGPNVWQSNRAGAENAAATPRPARARPERRISRAGPEGRKGGAAEGRKGRAAEGRKGGAAEGGAQSPKGAGRVVQLLAVSPARRRRARSGPISGRSAASSGPWSRPVSARRSGMNSARPLSAGRGLDGVVQPSQVEASQGAGGRSLGRLATRPVRDHRRTGPSTTAHHCAHRRPAEIAADREPERLAAADPERRETVLDPAKGGRGRASR